MIVSALFAGQTFWILGLGKSGLASAATLQQSGATVFVWDDQEKARACAQSQGFTLADPAIGDLTGAAALVLAPGIPLTHPAPHPAVQQAHAAAVPVIGDVELLVRACPQATFVGITGTNGKSTTTALIAHILKAAGRTMQVGGNLGTPVLSLDPLESGGIYVLELSSFQLDLLQTHRIDVAVLLNITPDHLNRHDDMAGYIKAKERILRTAAPQTAIIGTDEAETQAVFDRAKTHANLDVQEIAMRHAVTNGIMLEGDTLYAVADGTRTPLVVCSTLKLLPGLHNAQNVAAAFAACRALGLDNDTILSGVRTFPGLEHRQQRIATWRGISFINDSKATNADATSKALACYDNIYWILGGTPKAGGLTGLGSFMPRVRHAFLIGMAAEEFGVWCRANHVPATLCRTLDIAVQKAAAAAQKATDPQPVVLLSPACASYDQFSGFEERGTVFADHVHHLIANAKD